MNFSDLSDWDILMIREQGIHIMMSSRNVCRYEIIVQSVLECIHAKGFDLIPNTPELTQILSQKLRPITTGRSGSSESISSADIVKTMFEALESLNISFEKSSREPSWSKPNESWYHRVKVPKKPWMI